jgi:protein SCO1
MNPDAHDRAPLEFSRRSFLQALLCAIPVIRDHRGSIYPPVPVPDIKLVRHDGVSTTLQRLADEHATAVQLMFTQCTTTCPIGAAVFQRVQKAVPDMAARRIQLLSVSIDPKDDTPKALSAWRDRFHAGPTWMAAASATADIKPLQEFFGKGLDLSDHSNQVSILDRRGRLIYRTYDMPSAEEIIGVLQKI